jgi:hypothetical protein
MMKKLFFAIALSILPQLSQAAFVLNPALGMYRADEDNGVTQLELRIGYQFDFGLYLGGFYDLTSQKFVQDASEFYGGVHIGYETSVGIYALLGYVVAGDQDLDSGGIKYTGATGAQATLGYKMLLAEDVYLGPELTYRRVSFKNEEIQGAPSQTNRNDEVIIPGISVLFKF